MTVIAYRNSLALSRGSIIKCLSSFLSLIIKSFQKFANALFHFILIYCDNSHSVATVYHRGHDRSTEKGAYASQTTPITNFIALQGSQDKTAFDVYRLNLFAKTRGIQTGLTSNINTFENS
ncbi:Hypothetical predicted protein [Octopus vulgaris]|uniref:Uncharacterized protein n=1 Tax=Octopus vulgaris TaxID=6645 RepID=A0AA36B6C7_OCTVU|nr:Hypothetical predicted protein [Octopus vulgaris]